jgi:hypothetical protein
MYSNCFCKNIKRVEGRIYLQNKDWSVYVFWQNKNSVWIGNTSAYAYICAIEKTI